MHRVDLLLTRPRDIDEDRCVLSLSIVCFIALRFVRAIPVLKSTTWKYQMGRDESSVGSVACSPPCGRLIHTQKYFPNSCDDTYRPTEAYQTFRAPRKCCPAQADPVLLTVTTVLGSLEIAQGHRLRLGSSTGSAVVHA